MYSLIRPDNEDVVVLSFDIHEFRSVLEGMRILTKTDVWDNIDLYVYENLYKVSLELQELDLW